MTAADAAHRRFKECRPGTSAFTRGRRGAWRAVGWLVAAALLGGCSFNDGMGSLIIDPARYSVYHCKDLVTALKELQTRQKDLRALMDRAGDGGGGTVIAALSYRPDYEKVVSEESLLRRTAAEKQCSLEPPPAPAVQSDHTIH
jgi:hypothetical protein